MKQFLVFFTFLAFLTPAMAAERSPFTDVQYDSAPSVKVEIGGEIYYLLAIEGLSRAEIMETCQNLYGAQCERRFALNFVETMEKVGIDVGDTISLRLYFMPNHEVSDVADIAVTEENLESIAINRELRGEN